MESVITGNHGATVCLLLSCPQSLRCYPGIADHGTAQTRKLFLGEWSRLSVGHLWGFQRVYLGCSPVSYAGAKFSFGKKATHLPVSGPLCAAPTVSVCLHAEHTHELSMRLGAQLDREHGNCTERLQAVGLSC